MQDPFLKVKTVLGFGEDVEGMKKYYTDWAESYESDVKSLNWVPHEVVCDLTKLLSTGYLDREPVVLDAGCGTGLVGASLHQRGFKTIDGIDLNDGMVEVARKRAVYRHLRSGIDLNRPDIVEPSVPYDFVVSSGTFTQGHATAEALITLANYCGIGGFVIVSTRLSYLKATNFEEFIRSDAFSNVLENEFVLHGANYIDEEKANYWVFRRIKSE